MSPNLISGKEANKVIRKQKSIKSFGYALIPYPSIPLGRPSTRRGHIRQLMVRKEFSKKRTKGIRLSLCTPNLRPIQIKVQITHKNQIRQREKTTPSHRILEIIPMVIGTITVKDG